MHDGDDDAGIINLTPPTTLGSESFMYSGRPSGRPSTTIPRDGVSLYLVNGFQRNLVQVFTM